MDSFALLEKLCNIPGVTGFEAPVRDSIAELVKPFVFKPDFRKIQEKRSTLDQLPSM